MVMTGKHVSSSLRLARRDGDRVEGVRTFSGVRPGLGRPDAVTFLEGLNQLMWRPATNAVLTTRTEIVPPN